MRTLALILCICTLSLAIQPLGSTPSDEELQSLAHPQDLGIPLPLFSPRLGFPYMNFFNMSTWHTALLGLGWSGSMLDAAGLPVRKSTVQAYYGQGGMEHPRSTGMIDLAQDVERNSTWFAGGTVSAILVPWKSLPLDLGFDYHGSPLADNNWWQGTLGMGLELSQNPPLPADGILARLGYTTANSRAVLSHKARLSLLGALPLAEDAVVGTLSLEGTGFLGAPSPEFAFSLSGAEINESSPLVLWPESGETSLGDAAWSARAATRFRVVRIQGAVDAVFQLMGATIEDEPAWRNGLHLYLEPFAYIGGLVYNHGFAAPSWGGGLSFRFASSFGQFTSSPGGFELGCDASKLNSGDWFFLNFLF